MKTGLGSGSILSAPAGINCGADCDESYAAVVVVTLTATASSGSQFVGWRGACTGTSASCTVTVDATRSVRAEFDLDPAITPMPAATAESPSAIAAYLLAHPEVNTPARFVKALPAEFKQNWLLISRSESLQTGLAESPRLLLPSADARFVFTVGMMLHNSYPGSHPNAIEYMQWDAADRNFRFHEIVLDTIPAMGKFSTRSRGVSIDDAKCFKCHSTRNVLNRSTFPGTTGITPGTIKAKSKPNWDTYDSWGGMLPFNRDRIYQGTVEAAAFRKIFNLWTWRSNEPVRQIIEQLQLQTAGVGAKDQITRNDSGGADDGHIDFGIDVTKPVLSEPAPLGPTTETIRYQFDGVAGPLPGTSVIRGGPDNFVVLHHGDDPNSDEGRAVQLFDFLGGFDGDLNQLRIADELIDHSHATGGVPVDVRPFVLAILKDDGAGRNCLSVDAAGNTVAATSPLTIDLGFFNARNGMTINDLVANTRSRAEKFPLRKADIQKLNLSRIGDIYLFDAPPPQNGLIEVYGAATSQGTSVTMERLRQEVFRRPLESFAGDQTDMGGFYVDREIYSANTEKVALFRYFLEPLGVSVDKWSLAVRGRSRTYTFADVFSRYEAVLATELEASLATKPIPGLSSADCASLITAINNTVLPPANGLPTYTDVQRIFNKACIDCHGGLGYPPFERVWPADHFDVSEDESPATGRNRFSRSYDTTSNYTSNDPATSRLYRRLINPRENCPSGMMPCGGPALSKADIETIRRWIVGGRPSSAGDPHIRTVDGVDYDFQAAGEFVLLRDEGSEIQVRQTPVSTAGPSGPNAHTGLQSCVSLNTAFAVRVSGQRITYQPNLSGRPDPEGLQLRIDGRLMNLEDEIALANGGRILPTGAPGGIQILMPGGTDVVVTPGWWDHHQLWYLNIDVRHGRGTEGIMGAIAPNNWLPALPDGTFLGPRPADLRQRYQDLYGKFAGAWRVTDRTTLFDYAPGTATNTFTFAAWPGESPQQCVAPSYPGTSSRPPLNRLSPEAAKEHCAKIVESVRRTHCEQDVMVTGEPGFAETYLAAEEIQRNAIPQAPTLIFPNDDGIDLASTVDFEWNKSLDRDGRRLAYLQCVWAIDQPFTYDKCVPLGKQFGPLVAGRYPMGGRNLYILLFLFAAGIVLLGFLYRKERITRMRLSGFGTALLLIALLLFLLAGTKAMDNSVSELKSGKAYYWKVIAYDGNGGTVESETRRFAVK